MKKTTKQKRTPADSAAAIAGHVAALFAHPDTPKEITDGLSQGTSELFNRLERNGGLSATFGYVRTLVAAHLAEKGDED